MIRNLSLRSLALAGVIAAASVGTAAAQDGGTRNGTARAEGAMRRGHHGHRGFGMRRLFERLSLSDAQKAQIRTIMNDTRTNAQASRALPQEDRRAAMRDLRENAMRRVRAILTREQIAQLDALRAERQARRAQRCADHAAPPAASRQ